MTKFKLIRGECPMPHDLEHCPFYGCELLSGSGDRNCERLVCEYSEQEVAYG
jgi:hypothetical protein